MNSVFPIASIILTLFYLVKIGKMGSNDDEVIKWLFAFHLCVTLSVSTGFYVHIGSFELSYSEFTLIVLALYIVLHHKMWLSSTDNLLLIIVVLGWIITAIIPPDVRSVPTGIYWSNLTAVTPSFRVSDLRYLLRLFIFVIVLNSLSGSVNEADRSYLAKTMFRVECILLLCIAFEYVTKAVGNPVFESLKRSILGYTETQNWENPDIFLRGGTSGLLGFCYEPSNLSFCQFVFGYVLMKQGQIENNRKYILAGIGSIIVMLASTSFSGVLFASVLIVVLIENSGTNKVVSFFMLVLFVIGALVFRTLYNSGSSGIELFQYFNERFIKAFNTFNSYNGTYRSSEEIRIAASIESIRVFLARPLFGVGIGSNYCYATLPLALANLGLIGTVVWIKTIRNKMLMYRFRLLDIIMIAVVLSFIGNIGMLYNFAIPLLLFMSVKVPITEGAEYSAWNSDS